MLSVDFCGYFQLSVYSFIGVVGIVYASWTPGIGYSLLCTKFMA